MKRHSVLVVDDDAGVRSLYVDALEESGHRVAIAVDGAEALAKLREGSHPASSSPTCACLAWMASSSPEPPLTIRSLRAFRSSC